MVKIADVIKLIEKFAPPELAEDFDNCGLKIGNVNEACTGVLVTVDTNEEVVWEAKRKNCNLIIEHHPSIWKPLKSLDMEVPLNKMLVAAAKADISVYSCHTNVDYTAGGLNDYVAEKIGLKNVRTVNGVSSARMGEITSTTLKDFAKTLQTILDDDNISTVGNPDKLIKKVAVINGGGGNADNLWETYKAGADIFVTAEVKHSVARLAKDINYAIIQFGHYTSEVFFNDLMKKIIKNGEPDLSVISAESIGNPFNKRGEIWN